MEHELDHDHGVWTGVEFERPAIVEGDHHAVDEHYDVGLIPMHERTYGDVSIVPIREETLLPIDLTERHELLY